MTVSLRETRDLSSAKIFAECQILGTRQIPALPSAVLGKIWHSAFAECLALGKDLHSAKAIFAECLALDKGRHSAKIGRA